MNNRVVVTGMGIISPLGLDVPSTWQALVAGRSGIDYITLFDASDFDVKIAAEVKGFDPLQYIDRKRARYTDRFTQFAIAASLEAAESARLRIDSSNGYEVGVGGAGTISAAVSVLTIRGGVIPPTINLETPDPECDLDYVPNIVRQKKVRTVLSNSFGFGGHNASLVFRAYDEQVGNA